MATETKIKFPCHFEETHAGRTLVDADGVFVPEGEIVRAVNDIEATEMLCDFFVTYVKWNSAQYEYLQNGGPVFKSNLQKAAIELDNKFDTLREKIRETTE